MTTHPYGGPLIGLDGAVDLHCHPYPDLFPRLADDIDIAGLSQLPPWIPTV